jgi:hypothetical protein
LKIHEAQVLPNHVLAAPAVVGAFQIRRERGEFAILKKQPAGDPAPWPVQSIRIGREHLRGGPGVSVKAGGIDHLLVGIFLVYRR